MDHTIFRSKVNSKVGDTKLPINYALRLPPRYLQIMSNIKIRLKSSQIDSPDAPLSDMNPGRVGGECMVNAWLGSIQESIYGVLLVAPPTVGLYMELPSRLSHCERRRRLLSRQYPSRLKRYARGSHAFSPQPKCIFS